MASIRPRCAVWIAVLGGTLILFGQTGCATITRGANEQFTVQSVPIGAVARLSTGQTGFTPVTFKIGRKDDIVVVVSMEGYQPKEVVVKAQLASGGAAGFLGNALIGGVIGGAMDIGTGAALSHEPNPLKVILEPSAAQSAGEKKQSSVPALANEQSHAS